MIFDLPAINGLSPEEKSASVVALVEGLVEINRLFFRSHPSFPPLYQSRIQYDAAEKMWRDALSVWRKGSADCKSLVAWRVAELREAGQEALIHVVFYTEKQCPHIHLQIVCQGRLEDPSALCGMPT